MEFFKGRSYTPESVAKQISNGDYRNSHSEKDSYIKHGKEFQSRDFGNPQDVTDRESYRNHIVGTLRSEKTQVIHDPSYGSKGCDVYYNSDTNTVILVNRNDPARSTCYRDRNFGSAIKKRESDLGRTSERGGYDALHSHQATLQQENAKDLSKGRDRNSQDKVPNKEASQGKGLDRKAREERARAHFNRQSAGGRGRQSQEKQPSQKGNADGKGKSQSSNEMKARQHYNRSGSPQSRPSRTNTPSRGGKGGGGR